MDTKDAPDAIDAETLAGLMDGSLSAERRAEVLAQLARRPDLLEQLAAAAVALDDVGAASPGTTASRWRSWKPWYAWAAAASVAGVMLLARAVGGPDSGLLFEPAVLAPSTGSGALAAAYGADWTVPALAVTRGAEAESGDRAFLIGVRSVRWMLAVHARDTTAARTERDALGPLLGQTPAAAPIAALVADGTEAMSVDDDVARALQSLASEDPSVAAGQWAEQVRLASATLGDARVSPHDDARDGLRRLLDDPRLDAALRAALVPVRSALDSGAALRGPLADLYAALAR